MGSNRQLKSDLKIKKMKDRVLNNYITTLLGVLILAFAGAMIYMEKSTATEMSGWMALGVLFIRSKDSIIALPKADGK